MVRAHKFCRKPVHSRERSVGSPRVRISARNAKYYFSKPVSGAAVAVGRIKQQVLSFAPVVPLSQQM